MLSPASAVTLITIDAVPWPFALATNVPAPTANPLTEKLALAAPAAIVTELGALSAAPLAVNVTVTALEVAEGRLIVYVPIPPTVIAGGPVIDNGRVGRSP